MGRPIDALEAWEGERFALLLPSGGGWTTAALRRSYSSGFTGRTAGATAITVTLYPRTVAGGEYRDASQFLRATQRIPADIRWDAAPKSSTTRTTRYTDGTTDRYYALIETPAALLEIDYTAPIGDAAPPLAEIAASARVFAPPPLPPPIWETITLSGYRVEIPADWTRKDEHNRPITATHLTDATGVTVSRDAPLYATRQMSRPHYRIEQLAPGKNLRTYLVGLKTERHRSSIDGATYEFLGEDRIRARQTHGSRLRYQGYSPRGMRGPLEWYHELLLLEAGNAALLITAYCDWVERHHYVPFFAHITRSLTPR